MPGVVMSPNSPLLFHAYVTAFALREATTKDMFEWAMKNLGLEEKEQDEFYLATWQIQMDGVFTEQGIDKSKMAGKKFKLDRKWNAIFKANIPYILGQVDKPAEDLPRMR
jgi:hypothetical protein